MSDLDLSTSTRALLDAAKNDAPSKLAKAKIWGGVAATTAAAGAGAGAGAGTVAALGTSKLIAAGALFGSAVTVGLAMALMHVGPLAPSPADSRAATQIAAPAPFRDPAAPVQPIRATRDDAVPAGAIAPIAPAQAAPGSAPGNAASLGGAAAPNTGVATNAAPKPKAAARVARPTSDRDDLLERESRLVAEARGALVRGDARASLAAVRAAQALDSHALDPEELSLEARALRALGNEDSAAAAEAKLRARYPDHALAR